MNLHPFLGEGDSCAFIMKLHPSHLNGKGDSSAFIMKLHPSHLCGKATDSLCPHLPFTEGKFRCIHYVPICLTPPQKANSDTFIMSPYASHLWGKHTHYSRQTSSQKIQKRQLIKFKIFLVMRGPVGLFVCTIISVFLSILVVSVSDLIQSLLG